MREKIESDKHVVWSTLESVSSVSDDETIALLGHLQTLTDKWIDDHSFMFDPFEWRETNERRLRRKSFTEAGLYLYVSDNTDVGDPAPTLRDLVTRRVNDNRYYELLLRNPRDVIKYMHPINYMKSNDALDPDTASAVDFALEQKSVWSTERVPYRLMDLWQVCQLYDYECNLTPEIILPLSCLSNPVDVVDSTLSDSYALTHNILFYHNFGVEHPAFPEGVAPYDVEDILTGLILRYIAAGNCDIVLELVLAGVLQRQLPTDFIQFVMLWISERADHSGYVPGPGTEDSSYSGFMLDTTDDPAHGDVDMESWDDAEIEWAHNYHTNLVAATTVRIMIRDWGNLPKPASNLFDLPVDDLLKLGQLLDALSRYDLDLAANQIIEISDSPVITRFPEIFGSAVDFLRRQETQNGQYGFWTDEEILYSSYGNTTGSFLDDIVHPVTEICNKAIKEVESESEL